MTETVVLGESGRIVLPASIRKYSAWRRVSGSLWSPMMARSGSSAAR